MGISSNTFSQLANNYDESRPAMEAYGFKHLPSKGPGLPNEPEPEIDTLRRKVDALESACVRFMYSLDRKRKRTNSELSGGGTEQTVHLCHWPECNRRVKPSMWGCKVHWDRLPLRLRKAIWHEYRPGQEVSKSPSKKYLEVAKEVQEWIRASLVNTSV